MAPALRPALRLALLPLLGTALAACAAPATAPPTEQAAAPAPSGTPLGSPIPGEALGLGRCAELSPISLQLKWVHQAQFAGYYAAQDQGYFDEACLAVTILPGGPDIVPEAVVMGGGADIGVDFLPSLLAARDGGQDLVNIAQVFERSGTREIAWRESGIATPEDLKGRRVAVWMGGNQYELLAMLAKHGLDPAKDLSLVDQGFDMSQFLGGAVDAAAAMTYNELAQVLEAQAPDGRQFTLADLSILDFNQDGTAMLQDGLFVTQAWLEAPGHRELAERFLRASFRGWIYCRDHVAECVDATLARGPALPRGHQTWMMNEVNQLIWPSAAGIGQMDPAAFQRTADIAHEYGILRQPATDAAYVPELAAAALAGLAEDARGMGYVPAAVTPSIGGR